MAALNLGDILVRLGLETGQFNRDLGKAQKQVFRTAQGLQAAGKTLTAAVTVPIVATAAAAIKFASDFDAAMTQSIAIMSEFAGVTTDQTAALRKELEDTARTVAKDLNIPFREAGESFFFLASAGLDAEQSIAALPQVAAFAKAGMFSMALATDLATDAQSALGLAVPGAAENLKNLTRVTDVLVKANTLANASVEQFSIALTTKAGAAAKAAGVEIEEVVAVLAAFADQGIKAQDAGTAFNIVLRDLKIKAIENASAFEKFNVDVFDLEGNLQNIGDIVGDLEVALEGMSVAQATATLAQLGFTQKSIIFLQTIIGTSAGIKEYEAALNEAGGTTQRVAEKQMTAFIERAGKFKQRVIDVTITLGMAFLPMLEKVFDALTPLIDVVAIAVAKFAEAPAVFQVMAVGLAAVAAAAGPILIVLGQLTFAVAGLLNTFPGILKAASVAKTAFAGISSSATTAAASTGALAAAAVVGAGVIAATLTRSLDELGDQMQGTLDPIEEAVESIGLFRGAFSLAGDVAKGLGGILLDFGSAVLDGATKVPVIAGALEVASKAFDNMKFVVKAAAIAIDELGDQLAVGFEALFKVNDAAEKAIVSTAQLAQASKIAGQEITNEAEAARIITEQVDRMREARGLATQAELQAQVAAREGQTLADKTAAALGVNIDTLRMLAEQEGVNIDSVADLAGSFDQLSQAVDKFKADQEAALQKLRDMVTTTAEAQGAIFELSQAVELSGGVAALTANEIERLGMQFLAAQAAGLTLGDTATQITEKFLNMQAAAITATVALVAMQMEADTAAALIERAGGAAALSSEALEDNAQKFMALRDAGQTLNQTQQETIDLFNANAGAALTVTGQQEALIQSTADLTAQVLAAGGAQALNREALEMSAEAFQELADSGVMLSDVQQAVVDLNNELAQSEKAAADGAKAQKDAQGELTAELEKFAVAAGKVTDEAAAQFEGFKENVTKIMMETGGVISEELKEAILESARAIADEVPGIEAEMKQFLTGVSTELKLTETATVDWGQALQDTANVFTILGIEADSVLGKIIGSVTTLLSSFDKLSSLDFGGLTRGLSGIFGGGGPDVSGAVGDVAGGLAAKGAEGGAGFLAGIQGALGALGPFAAAIGPAIAGVTALVGALFKSEAEKIAKDIERDFGVAISDALAKAIEETADRLDLGRFEATLLNFSDIITEAGGAAEVGLQKVGDTVVDLQNAIALGLVPEAEGIEQVGEAFGLLAEDAVEMGRIADASLLQVIQRARELGQEIPEIAAFIAEQLGIAAEGIAAIIGQAVTEDGEITFGGIQVATLEDAQAQATIFAAGFFATLEEQGLLAAVDVFGPAFDEMKKKFQEFGADVDFSGIERFFRLAEDPTFRPLLEGVQGLNDAMTGLANAGFLTADSFSAFQQQGQAAFDQLIEAGLKEGEALLQLAPFLQSAIDASERFGFTLDDNTLALIEQAEAAGIGFETDPMTRMVEVLEIVALQLGATAEQLGLVGDAGAAAGTMVAEGFTGAAAMIDESLTPLLTETIPENLVALEEQVDETFTMIGETGAETTEMLTEQFGLFGEQTGETFGLLGEQFGVTTTMMGEQFTETTTLIDEDLALLAEGQAERLGLMTEQFTGAFDAMAGAAEGSLEEIGGTSEDELGQVADNAETAAEDLENAFVAAEEAVMAEFELLAVNATEQLQLINAETETATETLGMVGAQAQAQVAGFQALASAAREAASAVGSIPGGGGGGGAKIQDVDTFQGGGIVTEPTFALLGERGPELVLPLTGPEGLGGVEGADVNVGGGKQPINLTIQVGEETFFTQIEDATRTGKIRVHERSIQKFGD